MRDQVLYNKWSHPNRRGSHLPLWRKACLALGCWRLASPSRFLVSTTAISFAIVSLIRSLVLLYLSLLASHPPSWLFTRLSTPDKPVAQRSTHFQWTVYSFFR